MATPVWVQSQIDTNVTTSGTTVTYTLLHTFTSGNALVGQTFFEIAASGATVTSIQDNLGNNYTVLNSIVDGGTNLIVLWGAVNISGSPTSVTFTFSVHPTGLTQYCYADEVSGAGFIDAHAQQNNTTATGSPTSGSMTLTSTDLVLGYFANDTGSAPTAGSGFTLRINDTSNGLFSESGAFGAGTASATFTQSPTAGTGVVGGVALAPPIVFIEWGDELRGRQARRLSWRSQIRPDEIGGFPFTAVATAVNWGDIEQYIGPKRRRPWHPPPQPDGLIIIQPPGIFTVSLVETANALDTLTEVMTASWGLTESGSAADTVTAVMTASWTLTESGSAADHPTATMTASWTLAEAGAASDSSSGLMTASWTIAESDSAADNLSIPGIAALFEAGNAQDFLTFQLIIQTAPQIFLSYEFQYGNLVSAYNTGHLTVQQFYYALYKLQWAFSGATDWNTSFRPRAAPGDLPPKPIVPFAPTQMITNQADTVVDAATLVNTARALRALGCPPRAFPAPYPPRWAFHFYGGR